MNGIRKASAEMDGYFIRRSDWFNTSERRAHERQDAKKKKGKQTKTIVVKGGHWDKDNDTKKRMQYWVLEKMMEERGGS